MTVKFNIASQMHFINCTPKPVHHAALAIAGLTVHVSQLRGASEGLHDPGMLPGSANQRIRHSCIPADIFCIQFDTLYVHTDPDGLPKLC